MNLRDTIGGVLMAAFVGALFLLFWKSIPTANEQLIVYMLGQLSGFVAGVVAAHYTINAGQQKLDEKKADNTAKAFDAITETAKAGQSSSTDDPTAIHEGDNIKMEKTP